MVKELKGYIVRGCFGRDFSNKEASYDCELCGVHWTEAKIDGFESLKNYALSESVDDIFYEIENENDFNVVFDEDKECLRTNYLLIMEIALDDYDISYEDLYKIALNYWRNKNSKN